MAQKLVETKVVQGTEHRRDVGFCGWRRRRRGGGRLRTRLGPHAPSPLGDARLSRAGAGSTYRVARLHGDEAFRGKMMALGIVAGAAITIVQGGGGGPLVVALGGSRLLLDSRSAELVGVNRCGNSEEESGVGS